MTATITVDAIPVELRDWMQWAGWNSEEHPGKAKPDKVPYICGSRHHASIADPSTWSSFEAACIALPRHDGLSFALTAADPFVFVDLDHCVDLATGEIEPWAAAIVAELASYTEQSPSGDGLHIIVRGTLPPGRRKLGKCGECSEGAIEMYDNAHFMSVTGWHLDGTPTTIEARAAGLAALHARTFGTESAKDVAAAPRPIEPNDLTDEDVLDRARSAKNGERFSQLWTGAWAGAYGSQSEADLALCSLLAFWCGRDPARMDRLFRRSGLMRDKWDEQRGAHTYGATTVAKACAECDEVYCANGHVRGATVNLADWPLYRVEEITEGTLAVVTASVNAADTLHARGILAVATFGRVVPCDRSLDPLLRAHPVVLVGTLMRPVAHRLCALGHADVRMVDSEVEFETAEALLSVATRYEPSDADAADANVTAADSGSEYIETVSAFIDAPDPPTPYIFPDLLPRDVIMLMHGEARAKKTLCGFELALSAATGTPPFGLTRFAPDAAIGVLYVQEEDARNPTRQRLRRLVQERCGDTRPSTLHVAVRRGVSLDDPAWVARLITDLKRLGVKLLVLDAARRLSAKTDEGPAKVRELTAVLRLIVTQAGVTVVIVHHDVKPPRDGQDQRRRSHRASGGDWFAACECPVTVEKLSEAESLVLPEDYKHSSDPAPFTFRCVRDGALIKALVGTDLTSDGADTVGTRGKVLEYLRVQEFASKTAMKRAGLGRWETINAAVDALERDGKIGSTAGRQGGGKVYFLIDGTRPNPSGTSSGENASFDDRNHADNPSGDGLGRVEPGTRLNPYRGTGPGRVRGRVPNSTREGAQQPPRSVAVDPSNFLREYRKRGGR